MSISLKTIGIITVLSAAIGGVFGVTGGSFINDKKAAQYDEREDLREAFIEKKDAARSYAIFGMSKKEFRESNSLKNVARWTDELETLPKTKLRSEFAASILKASKDGVITEDEWRDLLTQKIKLDDAIVNVVTRDNANKLLDGQTVIETQAQ